MQVHPLRPPCPAACPYRCLADDDPGRHGLRLERPAGQPSPADVTIPRLPQVAADNWTDWNWTQITIEGSHCREIIDNVVDMAHFFYIHYSFPTYFKNVFEGQSAYQYMNGDGREDVRPAKPSKENPAVLGTTSVAAYHGPSFMIDEVTYHYEDMDVDTILINCHYPIDENNFVLMYGVIVEQKDGVTKEEAEEMAVKTGKFIKYGFEQDVAIWNNKAPIDNPLLCEEDGPVYQLRRWYQQFYVDVEEVTDEMTDRFEFEIDTTRPNEAWRAEVAENLAARAAKR
ncbi:hypothetical protein [Nocardioides alcanivorans]|uniref:hypothetical protein n=1 Tax=Nocardioides alcanivorans TaxID=2897352 RepID=UPI0024B04C89|nr:hypothetical protein [Nocardioides alcanivorans]